MLQIVENTLKEGKELEYISVAKQFTNDLNQLESVKSSKVYRNGKKIFIITDWIFYDENREMELFLKYKSEMKPLFVSNKAMQLAETE
ncbi:hypothetical protein [Streptococcus anginosus]|uniref:Uncharacterized protein n=1 Tax=Streptococcus anginosus TaxID=1328 RepID=A0AAP2K9A7_STRAP|nr:hypothetical protein [Streptococcus anginosus]MBZ2155671.1 hypothetical protein [Streptococcus anginosus]